MVGQAENTQRTIKQTVDEVSLILAYYYEPVVRKLVVITGMPLTSTLSSSGNTMTRAQREHWQHEFGNVRARHLPDLDRVGDLAPIILATDFAFYRDRDALKSYMRFPIHSWAQS